jgi:hypothetical protein
MTAKIQLGLWGAGFLLEAVILFRGLVGRHYSRYPLFYFYILSCFAVEFPTAAFYFREPASYARWYWRSQFLTMVTGCGIFIEVLRQILGHPEVKAFRRAAWLFLLASIAVFAVGYFRVVGVVHMRIVNQRLERDFRLGQALLLVSILGVILYCGFPIGRNLKGMVLGYGLYVGTSLVVLAVQLYRQPTFSVGWATVQPASYVVALGIWAITLWTYNPNIILEPFPRAEVEYAR